LPTDRNAHGLHIVSEQALALADRGVVIFDGIPARVAHVVVTHMTVLCVEGLGALCFLYVNTPCRDVGTDHPQRLLE